MFENFEVLANIQNINPKNVPEHIKENVKKSVSLITKIKLALENQSELFLSSEETTILNNFKKKAENISQLQLQSSDDFVNWTISLFDFQDLR